ncbi:hypothetical protein GCM10010429_44870 [Micromonospora olivasterospora]
MAVPHPGTDTGDAAVSQWATRVAAFTRRVGPGRQVTQTGRLTLAQAREFVPALDTGDVIDPVVHGRVHRTTSTEELPELNTTCAWAKAARLVRFTGGKLVAVQKNAVLLERPVSLWERMSPRSGARAGALPARPRGVSRCCASTSPTASGRCCMDSPGTTARPDRTGCAGGVGTRSAAAFGSPTSRPPTGTPGGRATTGMSAPPSACWSASAAAPRRPAGCVRGGADPTGTRRGPPAGEV